MRLKIGEAVTRVRPSGILARGKGDDDMRIGGLGAPYEVWTTIYDSPGLEIRERYARNCFKDSLATGNDVMCCRDHIRHDILGRLSNDTLVLREDEKGLHFEVTLNPADPEAMRIYAQVQRRDINGASTRFIPTDMDTKEYKRDGKWILDDTIVKATLFEVGPVTDPAYPTTTATARERDAARAEWDAFLKTLEVK